jgi:nitrite reductase (NADH) small subunit
MGMGVSEDGFRTVAQEGDIPDGEGRAFVVGDLIIAVFHVDGRYHAINDMCPHQGASLAAGHVEQHTVSCPWHGWRFRVTDGTWCDNPRIKTDSYPVRVLDGQIQVAVGEPDG